MYNKLIQIVYLFSIIVAVEKRFTSKGFYQELSYTFDTLYN